MFCAIWHKTGNAHQRGASPIKCFILSVNSIKTETKRFHSFEESIADMKTEKSCCDSPDMFMSDITHYIDQFCRGLDVYYHPQYASVYPSVTKEQLDFLRDRANVIHEAVDAMLDFIQHPENKTSKQENENE